MPIAVLLLAGAALLVPLGRPAPAVGASSALGRAEFAEVSRRLSEPEGYFDTDNLVSNEAGYLKVLPIVRRLGISGGAYLGVGPDQNFSYIAAVNPELAFIVDIRRQNLLLHLYLKALFELSPNRETFVRRLFGRPLPEPRQRRPRALEELLDEVEATTASDGALSAIYAGAEETIRAWKFGLGEGDFAALRRLAYEYFRAGPGLRFTSHNRAPSRRYPTYRELLCERDGEGRQEGYLASDAAYEAVRRMQVENRIIPVVGDLGGTGALPRIAAELRRRSLELSCFYVSNVEFYLFGGGSWKTYTANVSALPRSSNAVLIRSVSNNWRMHPASEAGYYMTTLVERVSAFLANENSGRHPSYWDVVTRDYLSP